MGWEELRLHHRHYSRSCCLTATPALCTLCRCGVRRAATPTRALNMASSSSMCRPAPPPPQVAHHTCLHRQQTRLHHGMAHRTSQQVPHRMPAAATPLRCHQAAWVVLVAVPVVVVVMQVPQCRRSRAPFPPPAPLQQPAIQACRLPTVSIAGLAHTRAHFMCVHVCVCVCENAVQCLLSVGIAVSRQPSALLTWRPTRTTCALFKLHSPPGLCGTHSVRPSVCVCGCRCRSRSSTSSVSRSTWPHNHHLPHALPSLRA